MKKLLNPLPAGGFPFENEDLLSLQTQEFLTSEKVYESIGSTYVVTGCNVTSSDPTASTCVVSSGYVYLGGELRPFPGYSGGYPFYVIAAPDTYQTKRFFDGTVQNTYVSKTAVGTATQPATGQYLTFGPAYSETLTSQVTGTVTRALADEVILRGQAVQNLQSQVTALQNEVKVPIGSIVMWTKSVIPRGWALCDGTLNTIDLRGRFVVGYDPNQTDYSVYGNTGGENFHQLTTNEMPSHVHNADVVHEGNDGSRLYGTFVGQQNGAQPGSVPASVKSTGGDQAHENRPPYYVMYFIQRIS
jgi:microcystin-dependent protein